MPDFTQQLKAIAALRADARRHDEARYDARIRLQKLAQRIARAEQQQTISATNRQEHVREDHAALVAEAAALQATADRGHEQSIRTRRDLDGAIAGIYAVGAHPRIPVTWLRDDTPFLLFPVRIETIFAPVTGRGGTELRVRIFPDDIVVHTHEPVLTDREVDAGRLYWVELVAAAHLKDEQERRRRAAWRHLVDRFGGPRAAWIARNTKPTDWNALSSAGASQSLVAFLKAIDAGFFTALRALPMPAEVRARLDAAVAANDGDALIRLVEEQAWGEVVNAAVRTRIGGFPAVGLTKTDAWSRAPRTSILPDRFVLLLYAAADGPPREFVGEPIPDSVQLGPDPLEPDETLKPKSGPITLDGECRWMADFDTAVAQGLAFRVPLSRQEAASGFARVVVLGVRLSANAADSASMVDALIENHQWSPKGFSLIAQGTPTNNTERDGSGYSDNDPYDDRAFYTAIDPPAFDPTDADPLKSQTDGRLLADALGIGYAPLQTVQRAGQTDVFEARAMNVALFPSTLGYWLKNWMAPVVTEEAARLTRTFFTQYVTGRGPLPAIRVGNQPYGVLVTSDMSRWKYPTDEGPFGHMLLFGDWVPFLNKLLGVLRELEKHWTTLARDVSYVGRPGSDASKVLMDVLGLHPTSVEFFQRIGFSAEYLRSLDSFMKHRSYANELESLLRSAPASVRLFLRDLGIERDIGVVGKTGAMHVVWQHYVDRLDVPNLVEGKPPSENNPLTFNYVASLAAATDTGKIVREELGGPTPAGLLYLMLRNALLLQLHHGSYEWLRDRATFEPALEQSLLSPSTLANVQASSPAISKLELMAVPVDLVQADHPVPGTKVADWIWGGPVTATPEAAYLAEQRAALGQLASASTARLERTLVEHLDCCAYRLDAWETGLFSERLHAQRSGGGQERGSGIYLGAFGWVEDLKPTPKVFLRPEDLPASLRPQDAAPILEEDGQGGYMHAPSINHAAACALLRNAYLSHSRAGNAEIFSVNLSSERIRRAETVLEGMRNGQPIEALLGYQFERGLHDLTSESAARGDVPVLELNEFIAPYRQAFPFDSREIPQAGTGPVSETVPPYSVVNGLKLSAATLTAADGYGLGVLLPTAQQPNGSQGAAILATRDALLDTLDAVKDLLTAENAYQLVQGNFDRVAAVSLAQKEARIPPALQVVDTPRGSEFTFTNRVTLHFDDLDPAASASNPWPAVPMTPRAIAEPGMNAWIATVLGLAPDRVLCNAYWIAPASPATRHDEQTMSLEDLQLQPIDLVSMIGGNDQRLRPERSQGSTELETRIIYFYRRTFGIPPERSVIVDFNPAVPVAISSVAQLMPLAQRVRALVGECRPLDARDFLPAAGGKATTVRVDKKNPAGYDVVELHTRVSSARTALTALADALDGPTAPPIGVTLLHDPATAADDEAVAGTLGDAFAALAEAGIDFTDTAALDVVFSTLHAESLSVTLRHVADFGISDAFPSEADLTDDGARRALLSRARRIARRLRGGDKSVLKRADDLLASATADKTIDDQVKAILSSGQAIFGDGFRLLPDFVCYNETDLALADGSRTQLLSHAVAGTPGLTARGVVDEWLQGLARVRPRLYTWEVIRMLADALGDAALEMRPAQVPFRIKDSWLAVGFPEKDPLHPEKPFGISRDTLSIVAHGSAAFQAGAQRGLLVDEWTEEIPSAGENTGITFRFNRPNAVPPQTLLLAVTPDETGAWDWDDLVGIVNDTLQRAKRRAVEPSRLEEWGLVWNALAPALVSEFSTIAGADVSLDLLLMTQYEPLTSMYSALKV
jgi:hypothetical protein